MKLNEIILLLLIGEIGMFTKNNEIRNALYNKYFSYRTSRRDNIIYYMIKMKIGAIIHANINTLIEENT